MGFIKDDDFEKPYNPPMPKFAYSEIRIDLSDLFKNSMTAEEYKKYQSEKRVEKIIKEAEVSVAFNTFLSDYIKALSAGVNNLFRNIKELELKLRENYLDKKYLGPLKHQLEMLEHCRKNEYLKHLHPDIDLKLILI